MNSLHLLVIVSAERGQSSEGLGERPAKIRLKNPSPVYR